MSQLNLIADPLAIGMEWVEVWRTTIPGEPQSRGSKSAMVPQKGPRNGEICPECENPLRQPCRDAHGRIIISMTDSNKDSGPYMEFARGWLAEKWGRGRQPINCPVGLAAEFFFKRPKSHMGSGKNAEIVKASSPVMHAQTPDLSKIIRTIEDCLSEIVVVDDRMICDYLAPFGKRWTTGKARTELTLYVPARYAHECEDKF